MDRLLWDETVHSLCSRSPHGETVVARRAQLRVNHLIPLFWGLEGGEGAVGGDGVEGASLLLPHPPHLNVRGGRAQLSDNPRHPIFYRVGEENSVVRRAWTLCQEVSLTRIQKQKIILEVLAFRNKKAARIRLRLNDMALERTY